LKRSSIVLVAALVAAVAVHVSVAWQDLPTLARNGYLYDDSFYAFQIARNIAEGRGPSFDGVHPTNGFQPLYVFLLVPFYRSTGGDPVLPIHLGLAMLAFLSVATAFLLYRILLRYVRGGVAAVVAIFWVFSPVVIRQTANGLETALSLFLLAASVHYYLSRIRSVDGAGAGSFVRLGLLTGLAVLARLDLVFLALAMALDYLVHTRARRRPAAVRNGLAAFAAALAVYSPWLVYGLLAVGRLLPESGPATRFLAIAYAPFFGLGSTDLLASGPDASFIWQHLVRSVSILKLTPAAHAFFRTTEKMTAGTSVGQATELVVNVAGALALCAFVAWVLARQRREAGARMRELNFLVLYCVCLVAAYSFVVFGAFFFMRYLYPLYFVAMIFLAFPVDSAVASLARRPALVRVAAATACTLYAGAHFTMGFNCCYRSRPIYHFYDVALWVEENTDERDTIGVFQSGAIGYLSNRKVVNLDGKVNSDAFQALKRGELASYISAAGIDVVMDNEKVLSLFLGEGNGEDPAHHASKRLFSAMKGGVPGWIGYRVVGADRDAGDSMPAGGGSTQAP
jgi:hypothetical protein